ncbi:DUF4238 domain-containing protein [Halorubrum ruber]|uniref:DUF4238 domain-containing protein n=1 Tax=Halorubrum ruber TaxID=2982524 RepID=A0A8T8LPA7_9EURY|nr:DUF4238 domain-containing protein [Halorubrum ruber]QUO48993.1 DUF4238 domain-containing protein [Halorubrum ruber]
MAEYKNQHYVPKYLLRGWTDNERVPVYNIDNKQEYPPTSISNLCSEDYFYGGPEVEQSMDGLEDLHANVINKIRDERSFNTLSDSEVRFFCVFVLLQRTRTKQTKKETEQLIDNLAKEYIQLKVESGEVDPELPSGKNALDILDDYKITHESPLSYPMLQALTGIELIIDLEVAILENKTDLEFVISDHPVVHDNPRFKYEIDKYLIGTQNRGLQIFVPFSDEVQVMLYDPAAYFVEYTNQEERKVTITSETPVEGLNDVQMINAFESIYYRNSGQEERFRDAQRRLAEYINENSTTFERLAPDEHDFETQNEMIESGRPLTDYSPTLPFVKQRLETDFAIERRPAVIQRHRNFIDEILEDAREKFEDG